MVNVKKIIYEFLGGIYIPKEILESKDEKLLHISDTPAYIFPGIKRLVKKLKPDYIIHTGDMVDNFKIEIYPQQLNEYEHQVKNLIEIMEASTAKKIIITLGNHDNREIVEGFCQRSIVKEKDYLMEIKGISFKMSHYSRDLINSPVDYNLFGHDLSIKSEVLDDKIYLNGISNINVINLKSRETYYLPYPWGTDDLRLCKGRVKI